MAGKVRVDGQMVDKPGVRIHPDVEITAEDDLPFVSRGGLKLQEAILRLGLDIGDKICLDVGASTGGFTDCLLQHGARRVYAVDVGYGQLAWKLRQDARVIVMERTNIRKLSDGAIPCPIEIAVVDVSFISLKIVVPAVLRHMAADGLILALVKPQFEVGKGMVGKGGVVRDSVQHQKVIDTLRVFFQQKGLAVEPVIPSPILGPKGNREFIMPIRT